MVLVLLCVVVLDVQGGCVDAYQVILIGSIDRSNDRSRVTIGSRPTVLVLLCFVVLDVQGGCVDAYQLILIGSIDQLILIIN